MLAHVRTLLRVSLPLFIGINSIACTTSTHRQPASKSTTAPVNDPSAKSVTSMVVLEPSTLDDSFQSWKLVNRNPDPIMALHVWPGLFGTIDRRGEDGNWHVFPAPQGHCATVDFDPELAPGETMSIGEMPLIGGKRSLPPGRYRFVVPHKRATMPHEEFAAVLPFEVAGLDTQESKALVGLLERADVRACPAVWSYVLGTMERTGAWEVLPSLFSIPATTLGEQIQMFTVLAHFPEQIAELTATTADKGLRGLGAAVTILENIRPGEASQAAIERVFIDMETNEDPPLRVVRAISTDPEHWPAEGVQRIIAHLERTASDPHRLAFAWVLREAGAKILGVHGRRAVQAMRRTAQRTRDLKLRSRLREMASRVAEDIGDEPPQPHVGESALESERDDELSTDACGLLFDELRTNPLVRFTPAARGASLPKSLRVTYEPSHVEPYRKNHRQR